MNGVDSLPKSKVLVYLRRSQDREDRQQLSIEKQDTAVKQIFSRDKTLVPIYLAPEEQSARKPGRPVFDDMIAQIESGDARYIATWALSRLSRNPIDGGRIIYLLDTGKLLAIHTPSRVYRNTSDDKLILGIELALAKKNNDDLSVQVKEGFATKRARGQYPGPAPIGYTNAIIRPGERNIAPHPEDADRVKQLFRDASSGQYTLHDLWENAFKIGLTSRKGGQLSKQTLNDLLQRKMYTGVFKYGGESWEKGSYEPLISVDLFDQVQLAMGWAKPSRRAKTAKQNYPYKGVMMCGNCGFNVTAYTKTKKLASGRFEQYDFYVCTRKSKLIQCKEPQIAKHLIDEEICSRMSEYQLSEAESAQCIDFVKQFYDQKLQQRNRYLETWKAQYKKATETIEYLDEQLENKTMSP